MTCPDFSHVLSIQQAETHPPHKPYDCAVELLPDISLFHGITVHLSLPKTEGMTQYIKVNLERGFIFFEICFFSFPCVK